MKLTPAKLLLAAAMASIASGCTPTQPIYLNDTGDLSTYIEKATSIEYPDVEVRSLDEVEQAHAPIARQSPDSLEPPDRLLHQAASRPIRLWMSTKVSKQHWQTSMLSTPAT